MRALTGYDRVTLKCGERRAESSRGSFGGPVDPADLPVFVTDAGLEGIGLFPRANEDSSAHAALLRSPEEADRRELSDRGIRAMLRVPFTAGEFCCESRSPREPSFELHAAAELFAQMFAMQLAIDEAANR
jgi:light-regulated signal transduction histidine kinase (bacteriophytochrome)